MEKTTIYYPDATTARERGELDTYRASAAELKATRDAIDAAISASFDGCRLERRCLAEVLQACSPERVAVILAATLATRTGDGRFNRVNRAWAEGVRMPGACSGENVCWYACRTHSAILDGFINLFRQHAEG